MNEVKPKVNLIAYSMPVGGGSPEQIVAAAAKLCYSKTGVEDILEGLTEEKTASFVQMLASMGHESPVEHISFTFAIEGISRACSHQLVRHRIASYSQQSQRYVDLCDDLELVMPEEIKNNEKARELYLKAMEQTSASYKEISDALYEDYIKDIDESIDERKAKALKQQARKKALEDARYVLPNACETKVVMTMNARSLYNFFHKRCCNRAQWEIKEVADQMLDLVLEVAPNVFAHAGASCAFDKCPEGKMSCGKVQKPRAKQSLLKKEGMK